MDVVGNKVIKLTQWLTFQWPCSWKTSRSYLLLESTASENESEQVKKTKLGNKSLPYYHITANKTQIKKSFRGAFVCAHRNYLNHLRTWCYRKGILWELVKYLCIDLRLSPIAVLILNRYVSGLQYVNRHIKCQIEVMKGNCLLSDMTLLPGPV